MTHHHTHRTKRRTPVLAALVASALLVVGPAAVAQDATDEPTDADSADPAVVDGFADPTGLPPAQPADGTLAPGQGTSFADLGFGTPTLRGTYGSADLFVPLPAGLAPSDTPVDVQVTHSPLLLDRSTLTLVANGVPLASTRLGPATADGTTLSGTIPADVIGAEGVVLSIRAYLRLTQQQCEEIDDPAKWVRVESDSQVDLGTARAEPVLADLPRLFAAPVAADTATTTGFDLDPSSDAELEAAGILAWQVGRWHAARVANPLVAEAGDADRVVAVSAGDAVEVAVANDTRPTLSLRAPADQLPQTARTLASQGVVTTLVDDTSDLGGRTPVATPAEALPWSGPATTFAQLGIDGRDAVGTGTREVFLAIDRPAGWDPTQDPVLELDLDVSSALREGSSTVQVLVNGTDLGTQPLAPAELVDTHRFVVPSGLVTRTIDATPVRTLDLTLRFVLDLPEGQCEAPEQDGARVTVLPTSSVEFPHRDSTDPELARFPYPLGDGGEPVLVIIPASPEPADVVAGLQVAAALGRWALPPGPAPRVVRADQVDDATAGDGVVIGEAAADLGLDLELGSPVVGDGDRAAALLAVGSWPGRGAMLVAVQGEGDQVLLGARALATRDVLRTLRGDRAAVAGDLAVGLGGPDAAPPIELVPIEGGFSLSRLPSYVVPAVVVGLALLLLLAAVIRFRWLPAARRDD